jgi:hypothetical protein
MRGWPFLVASGRRRDYSTLMAPAPLVEALDYGFLEETVRPGAGVSVAQKVTAGGRRCTVVFATHEVTADDVGDGRAARDEHGRPLRLLFGFVTVDAPVGRVDDADLATALDAVRPVYRRFLADEERVHVAGSGPFELRSPAPAPAPMAAPMAAAPASGGRSRGPWYVAAALAVAGLVVAGVVALAVRGSGPADDVQCFGTCPVSGSVSPSPSATPSASMRPSPDPGRPGR